jgi:hypothetical protein
MSVHFDKTKLDQVEQDAIDAGKRAVDKVQTKAEEVREDLKSDDVARQPVTPPPTTVAPR